MDLELTVVDSPKIFNISQDQSLQEQEYDFEKDLQKRFECKRVEDEATMKGTFESADLPLRLLQVSEWDNQQHFIVEWKQR
jgi:hypothetical protein